LDIIVVMTLLERARYWCC